MYKNSLDNLDYLINDPEKVIKIINEIKSENIVILKKYIVQLEKKIKYLEKFKFNLGTILDYYSWKLQGYTNDKILNFIKNDSIYLNIVNKKIKAYNENRNLMFGYPSNILDDNYFIKYLKYLESYMGLMNNCGDPNEHGNYKLDNKRIEQLIIKVFASKLGLGKEYWGYVTSGGTEGNFWGLNQGLKILPNAYIIYSNETHYSVEKYVNEIRDVGHKAICVDTDSDGRINLKTFQTIVESNPSLKSEGVVIILNYGTTFKGAIDPVDKIIKILKRNDIKYYCHLDAANFGGINMEDNCLSSFLKYVDSVSVSLHKFVGTNAVNGIVLSKKKRYNKHIDYIGQNDTTFLGSRSFPPFSTYQKVIDVVDRYKSGEIYNNVSYFKKILCKYNIDYKLNKKSNIFLFEDLGKKICKKYQLANHIDKHNNKTYTHIVIMPFHEKKELDVLAKDILLLTKIQK